MNCSTQFLINLIIDCSIISCSSASIFISFIIIIFIVYHLIKTETSPQRITLLLTGNMYFALLLFFILIIDIFKITFEGHIYPDFPSQNNRLCRVVFYTRKKFQSFQIYIIGIVLQWIICILVILPALVLNQFEYVIDDYHCQRLAVQRDIFVLFRICILLALMVSFFIPATIIFIISNSTGYLPWWSSQFRWITYVISMSSVTIALALISPHVMDL